MNNTSRFIFEDDQIVGVFINPAEVHYTRILPEDVKLLLEFESISVGWWHDFPPGTLGASDAGEYLEKVISEQIGASVRCKLFRENGHEIGLSDDVSHGIMIISLR
jgi:hypothetical protein